MSHDDALDELKRYASTADGGLLGASDAVVMLDERRDGEPITRVVLLLDDPTGDTWDFERVRELRAAVARKATELDLPRVSVRLVPRSEAELVSAFSR